MENHSYEDDPGLDGPDYVALVIEWDELAGTLKSEISTEQLVPQDRAFARSLTLRPIAAAVGAIGVILAAAWGVHRLRAA